MVIKFRLKELIAEKERRTGQRVRYQDIQDAVGVSTHILSKLAQQKQKMIATTTIDSLCDYFDCEPGDLIIRE